MRIDLCGYDKKEVAGGPIVWLQRFPIALRKLGFDVRIRLISWHDPEQGVVFQWLKERDFDVVGRESSGTHCDVRWLIEQCAIEATDVFIANLVVAGFYAGKYLRKHGIPTVGILHSDDPFYRGVQEEFIFGRRDLRLSTVVCVSRELEEQVNRQNPATTTVWRIPYGVPVPDGSVKPIDARFRIAYVGRLAEEQKRISEITRAFIRVCRAIPNAEAVIYGDGPDRSNVETILAAEGQGVSVRLAGNIPNDRIQNELLLCDVIALLSDYEGLPISLLEAMACGCVPVCLKMRSGIPELIDDGISGLIVADREESFQNAILRLHEDIELRTKLSQNAKQRIAREFSDSAVADTWAMQLLTLKEIRTNTRITVPRKISLSPRNPAIESEYQRPTSPSAIVRFFRKGRMIAGRLRRRLF